MCGGNPITAVDILDPKLAGAEEFGATHGVNAQTGEVVATVMVGIPTATDPPFCLSAGETLRNVVLFDRS